MLLLLDARCALAAPADLDPAFGSGSGLVITPVGASSDEAAAVVVQTDGKLIAGGRAAGSPESFALARYDASGTLDPTFGSGGTVRTAVGTSGSAVRALALASDGKIVAAGKYWNGSQTSLALVRYVSGGQLDGTFSGGKVLTEVGAGNASGHPLAIQPDGKILTVGRAPNGNPRLVVYRFSANGSYDRSFNGTGRVFTTIGTGSSEASAVVLQSDGKIVVAGSTSGAFSRDLALLRYGADGALDGTFGSGGVVVTPLVGVLSNDQALGVAVQSDGKIIVLAEASDGRNRRSVLLRYSTSGALDPTFGPAGTGKVALSIVGISITATAIALQSDGKIIVAGSGSNGGARRFLLARYDGNGTPDTTFGGTGAVLTAFDGHDAADAGAAALQGDGRIVVAGAAWSSNVADFALARYRGGPSCRPDEPSACDDGDPCTRDTCDPLDGCVNATAPATSCTEWKRGSLFIRETSPGNERLVAKMYRGGTLEQEDFGAPLDPAGSAYTLCIFADADALAGRIEVDRAGATCGTVPCWTPIGAAPPAGKGYLYQDPGALADGVRSVKLKGGPAGKSRSFIRASNDASHGQTNLPTGIAGALASASSATMQLFVSDVPGCFSLTLDQIEVQRPAIFKAAR